MLAHSPPLPLTVDYRSENGVTAEDEEGILLALEQRHRVRHLRLIFPVQNLQKLVMAIDEEFPILEYLIVDPWAKDNTVLMLWMFSAPVLSENQMTTTRPGTALEWAKDRMRKVRFDVSV